MLDSKCEFLRLSLYSGGLSGSSDSNESVLDAMKAVEIHRRIWSDILLDPMDKYS